MKRAMLLLFFLLLLRSAFSSVEINEVMYNPGQCSDTDCEWIELYNTGDTDVNLGKCQLMGENLSGNINVGSYLVVVRDSQMFFEFFGLNLSFNLNQTTLEHPFSLGNSGETIELFGSSDCNSTFDYSPYVSFANGNNKTLERDVEGEFVESLVAGGTPGKNNSVASLSSDYEGLLIWEVLPNPFDEDGAQKPFGEWVELYNSGEKEFYLGGLVLTDENEDNELVISDTTVFHGGGLFLLPDSYVVVYRDGDGDFALNNDGYEEVRLFSDETKDTLIDFMSYSGSVEGMSYSRIYGDWYETAPTPGEENVFEDICDWGVFVEMNNSLSNNNNLTFEVRLTRFVGYPHNVTVRGKIEDIHGETIRSYTPWNNEFVFVEARRQYQPNLPDGMYQISFWAEEMACQEDDPRDNKALRVIAIDNEYEKTSSELVVKKVRTGADNKVRWGDSFLVDVDVYKGNSTKNTIAAWVEKDGQVQSKKTEVKVDESYSLYALSLPVQLNTLCDGKENNGKALLLVEGFGMRQEFELTLEGRNGDVCEDASASQRDARGKVAYELEDFSQIVGAGDQIPLSLTIRNDEKKHSYEAWGYIYRGNKCYSCQQGRIENDFLKEKVDLEPFEEGTMDLHVYLDDDLDEGEYKLKIRIKKDNQKTLREITQVIYVKNESEKGVKNIQHTLQELAAVAASEESTARTLLREDVRLSSTASEISEISGMVVYENNSVRAQKMVPYFMAAGMLLVVGVMWFKR